MGFRGCSAILVIAACLAGCAGREGMLVAHDRPPVGAPIDQAIANNGPPSSQWDLPDGRRAYQWQQSSVSARVGVNRAKDTVVAGSQSSQTTCFYTLYTRQDDKGLWTVVGAEQTRPGCDALLR
jgi:hypothetical protein